MPKPATFGGRLSAAWAALRGAPPASSPGAAAAETAALAAGADAAGIGVDLEEARKEATALRKGLEAERAARADAVGSALASRLDPVLGEAAGLLAQLALQDRLMAEGKSVAARDVAALAKGFGRLFERLGLTATGAPGDVAAFDPAAHQALGGGAPAAGDRITVRMPGYKAGDRLIRKAMVEATAAGVVQ